MSVGITMSHHLPVPAEGEILAQIDGELLLIWPAGKGGPLISMSKGDWARIKQEVQLAYMRDDKKLAGYAAQEGNGYE